MKHLFYKTASMASLLLFMLISGIQTTLHAQVTAGNNSPVCIGSSVQLTSTFINGGSYFWQGPNGYSSSQQNPWLQQVNMNQAGLYTLVVTVNTVTYTDTTRVQVLQGILSNPGSNSPVCVNGTVQLSAQFYPNASYSWSGPNGFFSAQRNPAITFAQTYHSGNYSVTVSLQGCANATGTTSVTVSTGSLNIQAGSNSPVCTGSTLTMTATQIQNATYSWSGPVGYSSNQQTATLQNTQIPAAGIYTVTVSANGCSATQTLHVQVTPMPQSNPGSNSPVCAGNTIQLSTTPIQPGNYHWAGPNGFSSGLQNPMIQSAQSIHAGVYTLTLLAPGCPPVSGTTSVTVNTTTQQVQAGSNSPVCSGSTLLLTASSVNGATYFWSGPNGLSSALQNPVIQNAGQQHSGTWQLVISGTPCGNIVRTIQVSVQSPPQFSIGNNGPVCTGANLVLTATGVNQGQYLWTGPNGFSSTIQNPVITNAQTIHAGNYTLRVTVPGCNPVSQITQVVVNTQTNTTQIQAGSNSPICSGQNLMLTATTVTNGSYFWTGPNGFTSNQQNPVRQNVNPQMGGVYYVTVNTGCGNITLQMFVTIHPAPFAQASSNSPVCAGQSLQLASPSVQGAIYTWIGPNGFSSGMRTPVIQNAQTIHSGSYTVIVNVPGCGPATSVTQVVVHPTVNFNQVIAGSNSPVCTGQTLHLSASSVTGATYFWTGPNGFTSNLQNASRTQVTPQMSGVYYVTIQTNCGTITRQLQVVINQTPFAQAGSNSPICIGQTLSLQTPSISGAQYQWMGPNGYSSTMNAPSRSNAQTSMSGTYTVMVTTPGCGTASSTVSVTVAGNNNNTQQVQAGSNSPICSGGNLNLSVTTLTGASYSWTGPNGYTSNQQNPSRTNVNPNMSGLYVVTISGVGCTNIIRQIQVQILPAPTAQPHSNSPVCSGQTLVLSTPMIQGASYFWMGPGGYSASGSQVFRQNAQTSMSGIYTLMVSVPGCNPVTATSSVQVNAGPNNLSAGSNSPICSGNTLNLSASSFTGATYFWFGPNGFSSNQQNPTLTNATPQMTGTYFVVITSQACGSVTLQVPVMIHTAPVAQASSNSPLCSGQTLHLSTPFVTGANYLWVGPGGYSSNQRTPALMNVSLNQTGTYTVIVSTPGCGTSSSTTSVVVNTGPNQVSVSSNSPVCAGNTIQLSSTQITGATYLWVGPNGFSSNLRNPVIQNATPNMSGSYVLSISNTGCGTITMQTHVMVNQPVNLVAGSNSPVCSGNTLTLTAGPVNSNQYFWMGPNGFSATGPNAFIHNSQIMHSGNYTVRLSIPGCGMQQTTVQVTVHQSPNQITAGANSPVCMGSTLFLTGTNVVGGIATWQGPNGYSATGTQQVRQQVTVPMGGVYYYRVSTPNCGTAVRQVVVIVNDSSLISAIAIPNTVCAGSTLVLSASGLPGSSYQWQGPGNFNSNQQIAYRPQMQNTHAGLYTLRALVPGCGQVFRYVPVSVVNCRNSNQESELDLIEKAHIEVYPNPFTDYIQGHMDAGTVQSVRLMDLQGRAMGTAEIDGSGKFKLQTPNLSAGLYLLQFETKEGDLGVLRIRKD